MNRRVIVWLLLTLLALVMMFEPLVRRLLDAVKVPTEFP